MQQSSSNCIYIEAASNKISSGLIANLIVIVHQSRQLNIFQICPSIAVAVNGPFGLPENSGAARALQALRFRWKWRGKKPKLPSKSEWNLVGPFFAVWNPWHDGEPHGWKSLRWTFLVDPFFVKPFEGKEQLHWFFLCFLCLKTKINIQEIEMKNKNLGHLIVKDVLWKMFPSQLVFISYFFWQKTHKTRQLFQSSRWIWRNLMVPLKFQYLVEIKVKMFFWGVCFWIMRIF